MIIKGNIIKYLKYLKPYRYASLPNRDILPINFISSFNYHSINFNSLFLKVNYRSSNSDQSILILKNIIELLKKATKFI